MGWNRTVVSLFAGIGGFEVGFHRAGYHTSMACEIDPHAQAVLRNNLPDVRIESDVATLEGLPDSYVVTAGFPCQNLSLVGDNSGISGRDTKIVFDLFNLLERSRSHEWLVLENVPFMLWQKKGEAIHFVTKKLKELGYRWAYRVVDARSFGVPQRRRRVVILASRQHDPRGPLFSGDAPPPRWIEDDASVPCGFSWTEGRYGLGWAVNCVPTIKGGSRVGVPSPPAIWFRDSGVIGCPSIEDAERLQGFDVDWTLAASGANGRPGPRWKLVGNAIPVGMSQWIAERLAEPVDFSEDDRCKPWISKVWPNAAYDIGAGVKQVQIGEFPSVSQGTGLKDFLQYPVKPLSERAARGFLKRAKSGSLRFVDGFLDAVDAHADRMAISSDHPQTSALRRAAA